jgi:hypothetical protein
LPAYVCFYSIWLWQIIELYCDLAVLYKEEAENKEEVEEE